MYLRNRDDVTSSIYLYYKINSFECFFLQILIVVRNSISINGNNKLSQED